VGCLACQVFSDNEDVTMDNPRPEKVAVVDEVREHFERSDAAILTEYRGLKVKDMATLRRSLRAVGGDYKVYKNTLVRFAARDLGLADLEPMLVGPTAIAFVDGDAVGVAKALRDYARTNPILVVKGGVLGSKVMSPAETTALADMPSRQVLLARFAGSLAAPLQQFAGLLQAVPRSFAYGLRALIDKGGANPGAETVAEPTADASVPDVPAESPGDSAAPPPDAAPTGGDLGVEAPAAEAPAAEAPAAEAPAAEAPAAEDESPAEPPSVPESAPAADPTPASAEESSADIPPSAQPASE